MCLLLFAVVVGLALTGHALESVLGAGVDVIVAANAFG
jgi:hypothetical protein